MNERVRVEQAEDVLWYTRCPIPTALSLALHSGELGTAVAPLGVSIRSLRHSADVEVRLSHFTHSLPGQIRHGGHIPPLWSRSEGRDVRLLGLSWANEKQFVLVEPASDIEAVADLKGRRLAVPLRPNYPIDFWRATVLRGYQHALATAGLTLDDVTPVDVVIPDDPFPFHQSPAHSKTPPGVPYQTLRSQSEEGRALVRGEVDAIFSPAHYGVVLRNVIGARVLIDLSRLDDPLGKLNNFTLLSFTIDGAFLDRRPEVAQALLETVLGAAEQAPADPRAAARVVAAESGNAEDLAEDIFGAGFLDDLAPRLTDDVLAALEEQTHFLHRNGFISREIPVSEWIAPEPLHAAREALGERGRRAGGA